MKQSSTFLTYYIKVLYYRSCFVILCLNLIHYIFLFCKEPILSSGYICQFNDLEVKAVLLDEIMKVTCSKIKMANIILQIFSLSVEWFEWLRFRISLIKKVHLPCTS